jgi:hypothetical protein
MAEKKESTRWSGYGGKKPKDFGRGIVERTPNVLDEIAAADRNPWAAYTELTEGRDLYWEE